MANRKVWQRRWELMLIPTTSIMIHMRWIKTRVDNLQVWGKTWRCWFRVRAYAVPSCRIVEQMLMMMTTTKVPKLKPSAPNQGQAVAQSLLGPSQDARVVLARKHDIRILLTSSQAFL